MQRSSDLPHIWWRLISVDYSEAEKIEGVQVVRDGDLVAVLHELPDVAEQALTKVKAEYHHR